MSTAAHRDRSLRTYGHTKDSEQRRAPHAHPALANLVAFGERGKRLVREKPGQHRPGQGAGGADACGSSQLTPQIHQSLRMAKAAHSNPRLTIARSRQVESSILDADSRPHSHH